MHGGLFHTSPIAPANANSGELDYTVVQLADPPAGVTALSLRPSVVRSNGRVAIIQHPGGSYKKISMQNNFVAYIDEYVVQYTTCTEPGASGSPVIDDDFAVVALHHAGGQLTEPATGRRYLRNEGIAISAILRDLRERANELYRRVAR
jgi:V8-like Glu-specific endopeptidase